MEKRIYIKDLQDKKGKEILISGWVSTKRKLSNVIFIILRDMTGNIQCVINKEQKELFELSKTITTESVLTIKGILRQRDWDYWEGLKNYKMKEGTGSSEFAVDGDWYEEDNDTPTAEFGWAEIEVSSIEVLSMAKLLPFSLQSRRPSHLDAIKKILEEN